MRIHLEQRARKSAYNVDLEEVLAPVGAAQSKGRFRASCRETGTTVVSVNAEHDVCHALTQAGHADGPVQFWRGTGRSLAHPSIHRMGHYRISLGEQCLQRVKRKGVGPKTSSESVAGSFQNREVEPSGAKHAGRGARP